MTEPMLPDDEWPDDEEYDEPTTRPWRRPLLVVVASVTAFAMAAVPLYNVLWGRSVAENGLEVCGFDYCIVQESVTDAGLDGTMSRMANTFLDADTARELVADLTLFLGERPIGLQVVTDLDGRIGGMYDPETRSIAIEQPATAWTVLHEVAHARAIGHGEEFQGVVIDMARWIESTGR